MRLMSEDVVDSLTIISTAYAVVCMRDPALTRAEDRVSQSKLVVGREIRVGRRNMLLCLHPSEVEHVAVVKEAVFIIGVLTFLVSFRKFENIKVLENPLVRG